ncbi:MAG: PEP-CTERM sorting domain-containing protein [Gemmatimonadota bacterium]
MIRSIVLASVLLATTAGTADAQQDPTVLFIGNSFTYGHGSAARFYRADTVTDLNDEGIGGVPAFFKSFTEQAGLEYDVYLETRGGSGFEFHLENKMPELTSRAWDYVVAHGQSTLDLQNPGDPTKFLASGREFVEVLTRNDPGTEIYLTSTWSRADMTYPADGTWHGRPIETLALDVRRYYDELARLPGVAGINPVGEAWNRAMREGVADPNPYDGVAEGQLDLWTWDHYHASTAGYYLEALVVFGNVTGVDPRSLGRGECSGFELGLSTDQVEALQRVAYEELVAQGIETRAQARAEAARQSRCAA